MVKIQLFLGTSAIQVLYIIYILVLTHFNADDRCIFILTLGIFILLHECVCIMCTVYGDDWHALNRRVNQAKRTLGDLLYCSVLTGVTNL